MLATVYYPFGIVFFSVVLPCVLNGDFKVLVFEKNFPP